MDTTTRPSRTRAERPGFTLLEMLLAISLSSLVVLSTMTMLGMLYRSDSRLADMARDNDDLAVTQEVIRRAMTSLIAAPPLTDEQMALLFPEGADAEPDSGIEPPDFPGLDDENLAPEPELAMVDIRPRFDLRFEPSHVGMLPRLEIVAFSSPVPTPTIVHDEDPLGELAILMQDTSAVRGAFEVVEYPSGWALQWTPIEPWAYPTILVKDIEYIEWEGLASRSNGAQWSPVFSAYLSVQYPVAVRLILWTHNGSRIDWLFKTEVIPGEAL